MTTVWKKAVEAVEVGEDKGDILAPLKRVYDQYRRHAGRLIMKAEKAGREMTENESLGLVYYSRSADSVLVLINQ